MCICKLQYKIRFFATCVYFTVLEGLIYILSCSAACGLHTVHWGCNRLQLGAKRKEVLFRMVVSLAKILFFLSATFWMESNRQPHLFVRPPDLVRDSMLPGTRWRIALPRPPLYHWRSSEWPCWPWGTLVSSAGENNAGSFLCTLKHQIHYTNRSNNLLSKALMFTAVLLGRW